MSLEDLLAEFDGQRERPRRKRSHDASARSADPSGTEYDRENDRNGDRKNDRDSSSEDRPIQSVRGMPLNLRQRWYLDTLSLGLDVRAADLRRHWGVSEKTARRDLAELKALGMIRFIGPRRGGRYESAS